MKNNFIFGNTIEICWNMKFTQHAINRIIMIVMQQLHAIAITLKIAQPYDIPLILLLTGGDKVRDIFPGIVNNQSAVVPNH